MQTIVSFLVTILFSITRAYAANNWDEPCISGVCHYDLDSNEGLSSGTVKIWGSHKAISDITPAAGWHILECDEDAMEQVIRMVCISQTAACSHLFSHSGPEHKIVRLPERCGKNPFARVVRVWTSHDQSFPPNLARRLRKRDGMLPPVYNMAFDTDFHAVDPKHGPVNFAVKAATIPNVDTNIDTHVSFEKRSGRPVQRSHEDIVVRSIESIRDSVKSHDAALVNRRGIAKDIKTGIFNLEKNAKNSAKNIIQEAKTPFNKQKTFSFSPNFGNTNITLFKETINCPPFYPGVEVDLNPQGGAHITIGVSVSGTIIPPHLGDFVTFTKLSAEIDATLTVDADVFVLFNSGARPVMKIPVHGLDFPGILKLGPELQLNVQAQLSFDIMIGTRINIGYHVKDAEIIFPQKKGQKPTAPNIGFDKGALKVSSTPFVRGMAQADFHIIPTVRVNVDSFGKDTSGFNIEVDNSLIFRLISEANAKTRPLKTREFDDMDLASRDMSDARQLIHELPISARNMEEVPLSYMHGRNTASVVATNKRDVNLYKRSAPLAPGPDPWAGGLGTLPNVDTSKSAQINGCFVIYIFINFSVGANSVFLGIFDTNTRYTPYRQGWKVYEHCVGTSQPKGGSTVNQFLSWWKHPLLASRSENTSPRPKSSLVKRGQKKVKCLSKTIGSAVMIGTKNINFSKTTPLH